MPRGALTIGRYQPFHNGHYDYITRMYAEEKNEIVIGIGSSQLSNEIENPFTWLERRQMIDAALRGCIDYRTVPIPDVNNYEIWVGHVEKILERNSIPRPRVVYTNNLNTKKLFETSGYLTRQTQVSLNESSAISATRIRKDMSEGGILWREMVPQAVYEKICELRGAERIRRLYTELV